MEVRTVFGLANTEWTNSPYGLCVPNGAAGAADELDTDKVHGYPQSCHDRLSECPQCGPELHAHHPTKDAPKRSGPYHELML